MDASRTVRDATGVVHARFRKIVLATKFSCHVDDHSPPRPPAALAIRALSRAGDILEALNEDNAAACQHWIIDADTDINDTEVRPAR